jgi:hypothetical protein
MLHRPVETAVVSGRSAYSSRIFLVMSVFGQKRSFRRIYYSKVQIDSPRLFVTDNQSQLKPPPV